MTRPTYRKPAVHAHRYRSDLPKVVTVHDNRFLAPALLEALQGRAEVVGDTAYGAAALQLAQMLTPDVVVAGELLGDGLIDHFLPHLVRAGTRVLLVVEAVHRAGPWLLAMGLSGVCSVDDGLADLARAVLDAAAGGAVVPPSLVASIVVEWRAGRRQGGPAMTREKPRCVRWKCSMPWLTGCPPRPRHASWASPSKRWKATGPGFLLSWESGAKPSWWRRGLVARQSHTVR